MDIMEQREQQQIEQRIDQICNDREHGSRWLVREAILILRDLAKVEDEASDFHQGQIKQYARQIAQARPAMAALTSAVSRVVSVEGGLPEIAEEAERLLAEYDAATARIAEHAVPYLRGHLLTCSLSGTVLEVLLARRQQIESVTVLEGRPRYEGRAMAQALAEQGLAVTLITDAQADIFLAQCQAIVVGADSVLVNGDVLNKAGTALLSWAAHGRNIPLYVLCETLKISPRRWIEHDPSQRAHNLGLLEEKEPDEVVADPLPGVTVRNFYFDRTPYRLVTHVITEQGVLDRRTIREIAVKTRINERMLLRK
jgi:ribose 1,5-bisphosphate isomerase